MNDILFLRPDERKGLWKEVFSLIEKYFENVETLPVVPHSSLENMLDLLKPFTFENPYSPSETLNLCAKAFNQYQLHVAHPAYYGVFNPKPSAMGIAADALVAAYNPQLASTASGAFCIAVEEHLIKFFGERFGFEPGSIEGTFTSGGTEANYTALLMALSNRYPAFNDEGVYSLKKKPLIYVSTESHHSILKSARMCGIGTSSVQEIPVDKDLKMNLSVLKEKIREDRARGFDPFFLVGTLGSTSAGVVDPLDSMCQIAQNENLWFHVDAAWGGAAVLLPEFEELFRPCRQADSITLDPHKWFSVPMGSGLFLSRHPGFLEKTFKLRPSAYMPAKPIQSEVRPLGQPYQRSMSWSRRAMGMKLFMTLAVAGVGGYRKVFRRQIKMGQILKELLEANHWRIANNTILPVVCFVDRQKKDLDYEEIAKWVAKTGKAWITTTRLSFDGELVLRAGISNYSTVESDLKALVDILSAARDKLKTDKS